MEMRVSRRPKSTLEVYEKLQKAHIPGIPQILSIEPVGEEIVVEEEVVAGPSLEQMLAVRELSREEILFVMDGLCEILAQVHSLGIVHRDIKPEHILKGDRIYLIDFGAARLQKKKGNTDTTLLGTPGYASPEQYGFGQSDGRSDIYALGQVLAEMDWKGRFARVVKKATQMDPDNRYQSVDQLQKDLHRQKVVFPGYNSEAKVFSLFWTVLVLWMAAEVVRTGPETIWDGIGIFWMLWSPWFFWVNTNRYRPLWQRLVWAGLLAALTTIAYVLFLDAFGLK